MEIDLETNADRRQLQYLIKIETLEETKNDCQEIHRLKDSMKIMRQQQQQQPHSFKTRKKTNRKKNLK